MPSSISNSNLSTSVISGATEGTANARLPQLAYGKIWAWVAVLLLCFVVALEILLPMQGYWTSVSDSDALWAVNRAAAYPQKVYPQKEENVLVILGFSRSQLGVVPEVLAQKLENYRVVHLAVNGAAAPAAFADLASDPAFVGTILFDIDAHNMFNSAQQPWVDYFHEEWMQAGRIDKSINTHIQAYLQSQLVFYHSQFSVGELIWARNLRPSYLQGAKDRYLAAYFFLRLNENERAEQMARRVKLTRGYFRDGPSTSPTEFADALATEYGPLVAQLRARGGDVIFLRMPISGEVEELVESTYPKAAYWDTIAPTLGVPTVHYRDAEGLRGFICPDGSHLDAADARIFTANLADELIRRGLVAGTN